MAAILDWGGRHFCEPRAVCIIDPANTPSLRLATKCGFEQMHRTTYMGDPTIVLARRFARGA